MSTSRRMSVYLSLGTLLVSFTTAKADVIDFVANLNSICAETTSTATGFGVFSLNTQTGLFTWNIEHTVENSTFAHIHGPIAQACGSQGGGQIVIDLGAFSPMTGTRVLNATKQQEVLNGLWYVNVHTDKFVAGEISGVIVRAPEIDKCRHISFVPGNAGANTAIRINLTSLHHVNPPYNVGPSVPFSSFEGQVRWAGPPAQFIESSASGVTFHSSMLQCAPHYQDWGSILRLHLTGSAIVPSSIYDVEVLSDSCMGNEAGCAAILDSFTINTTRWADVAAPYNPPDTTAQPNISDVLAMVSKFRSSAGAPIKARVLIAGSEPFGNISVQTMTNDFDFTHIASCVDAFRGKPYPYTIEACP
jgi:hypothetical protein